MSDQFIERVENLIRVVSSVRDEDFNLGRWCDCAIGHAMRDAQRFGPPFETSRGGVSAIGKFFDISITRAVELFVPGFGSNKDSRKDVLAALRVLLLEKQMAEATSRVCIEELGASADLPELADA